MVLSSALASQREQQTGVREKRKERERVGRAAIDGPGSGGTLGLVPRVRSRGCPRAAGAGVPVLAAPAAAAGLERPSARGGTTGGLAAMSGGNGEGPAKRRQSGGAAIARLAGETSDNMKKPNDGGAPLQLSFAAIHLEPGPGRARRARPARGGSARCACECGGSACRMREGRLRKGLCVRVPARVCAGARLRILHARRQQQHDARSAPEVAAGTAGLQWRGRPGRARVRQSLRPPQQALGALRPGAAPASFSQVLIVFSCLHGAGIWSRPVSEDDLLKWESLVIGPALSPYAFGFFTFRMQVRCRQPTASTYRVGRRAASPCA